MGSSEIIPKTQVEYLASNGFVVVSPNYRLAPQATAKETFADCEEAYDWAISKLPEIMQSKHEIQLDTKKVVTMGHSSGGTLAMHIAAVRPIKAATALYPSLYASDPDAALHKPTSAPPFGSMPDFEPNQEEWATISPADVQVSEAALGAPGTIPPPRNRWQAHLLKNGLWMKTVCPDGNFAVLDPLTKLNAQWPPIMIVQGSADAIPGSGLDLVLRAEKALKEAGVKEVEVEVVDGEAHMFDLPPMVGTSDLGPKWQAVVKGMDWLKSHV